MSYLLAFVVGLAGIELVGYLAYKIQRWRADRSDPYVTLSDRKMRLEALRKK